MGVRGRTEAYEVQIHQRSLLSYLSALLQSKVQTVQTSYFLIVTTMLLFIVARFRQFIIYLLVFIISYFKFINCYQSTKSECLQLLQTKLMLLQEKFRNSIKPEKVLLLLQKILFFGLEIYRSLLHACVKEQKTC